MPQYKDAPTIKVGDYFQNKNALKQALAPYGRFTVRSQCFVCCYQPVSNLEYWAAKKNVLNTACPVKFSFVPTIENQIRVTDFNLVHDHTLLINPNLFKNWLPPSYLTPKDARNKPTLPSLNSLLPPVKYLVAAMVAKYAATQNLTLEVSSELRNKSTVHYDTLHYTCVADENCAWRFSLEKDFTANATHLSEEWYASAGAYRVVKSNLTHNHSQHAITPQGPPKVNSSPIRVSPPPAHRFLLQIDPSGKLIPFAANLEDFINTWKDFKLMDPPLAEDYLIKDCKLPWIRAAVILSWLEKQA